MVLGLHVPHFGRPAARPAGSVPDRVDARLQASATPLTAAEPSRSRYQNPADHSSAAFERSFPRTDLRFSAHDSTLLPAGISSFRNRQRPPAVATTVPRVGGPVLVRVAEFG